MPGSTGEDFLKKCINFKLFTPKLSPLMDGSGNLQFLVSLPYRCYIPNLVKFGPVVLENNDGCQPIAIGHLSYSSTLPYRRYTPNLVKIGPVVLKNNDGCQPIAIGHLSYSSTSIFILKEQRESHK